MRLFTLLILALSSSAVAAGNVAGEYKAVTETEYAISLALTAQGQAAYDFVTWSADDPTSEKHEKLSGTWKRNGKYVTINLGSGRYVTYDLSSCLPYQEFGADGCSMGLKPTQTNLAKHYGLLRFGLWESKSLRQP